MGNTQGGLVNLQGLTLLPSFFALPHITPNTHTTLTGTHGSWKSAGPLPKADAPTDVMNLLLWWLPLVFGECQGSSEVYNHHTELESQPSSEP